MQVHVARDGRITGLKGNISRQDKLGFEPLAPALRDHGRARESGTGVEASRGRACAMRDGHYISRPDVVLRANDMLSTRRDGVLFIQ